MKQLTFARFIALAGGPISAVVGWLSVQITNHLNLLGSLGFSAGQVETAKHYVSGQLQSASSVATVGGSPVAHAIFSAVVFAVGAGGTFLLHHKALDKDLFTVEHDAEKVLGGSVVPATVPVYDQATDEASDATPTVQIASANDPAPVTPVKAAAQAPTAKVVPVASNPPVTGAPETVLSDEETEAKLRAQLLAAGLTPAA
jgi:hypothetical protein